MARSSGYDNAGPLTPVGRVEPYITAYNAEEWLLDRLERHYPNPNDVRDLL
jgi:hypothetical protein